MEKILHRNTISDEQEEDYKLDASYPLENPLKSLLQNCALHKEVTQASALQEPELTEFVQSRENGESFVEIPVAIPQAPERDKTLETIGGSC